MTTRAVASLLRKAWLLAATLAVIAGLLGMHVLTSGHAAHGAPAGHAAVAHSAAGGHSGHAGVNSAVSAVETPSLASAICGGSCPGAQEAGAPCVPSAPSGPVTLAPPQAAQAAVPLLPAAVSGGSAYGYVRPGPTPCELSISRT